MVYQTTTSLTPDEVIARAKEFFSERVPNRAAFPEHETAAAVSLRGQGGEEVVIATFPADSGTGVRGSTLMFDQTLDRFLATLPTPEETAA